MRARAPYAALAAVVIAMLVPVALDRDSYPFSTYPMFARDRARISHVATVIGRTGAGKVERLSPRLIAGTDEIVLAVETVLTAVRGGPEASGDLCRRVAERVASARPDVETIEVRIETHDPVEYFTEQAREPRATDVRATCPAR